MKILESKKNIFAPTQFGRLSHIADDGKVGQRLEDGEPDADVGAPLGDRPARLAEELLRVQPDLHPVVEQREQWRQRERRHENGDEAELKHCAMEVGDEAF